MKALKLTAAVTALANAVASSVSLGELTLMASLFVQLGDTLATIAAERALSEERVSKAEE